ncbi:serine-rich adhesin for platelets [Aplysia californica]|uniref:Serine-rich adhesin for platelets n=1 Tax=Aplysia californica TaxID=6500 RepID=A0ABM1A640_APLCA|nr:serine-rich adhesin for platelets [Aplysia californica]
MNLCRCCKTSHRGLRFMHSQPGNADDVKNKLSCEVLAALGDTSLSWFDDLTAAHIDAQATRKDAERQVQDESEFWSPCPRGGVFSVAVPNKNRNGDMTPMTALLSTSGNTSNILLNASPSMQSPMNGLKCDQSAISWTSAMATPLDPSSAFASFSESKDENFAFGEMDEGNITITEQSATEAGKLKPFSRQLFSPGQTSLNDDSLSEMFNADAATSDMTVELESTLMSEGELPCTADNTLTSNPESAEKVNEDGRKMKKSWPHGSGSVVTVGDHTENRQGVKLACLKEPSHSNGDLKGSRFPAHELSSESGKKGSSIRDDAGRGSREKGLTVLDNSDVGGDCSIAVSDRSGLSEENFQDFQTPHEVENERVKDKDRSVEDERRSSHIDELLSMVFCSQESSPAEAGTKDGGQVTQMHVEENTKCEVSGVGERCSGNKDRRAEVQALNLPRDSLGVNTLFDGTRKNSDLGDVDQTTPVRKVGLGNVQSFVGESCDPGKGCSNLEHSLVPMTDLGKRLSNGLDEGSKTPQSILKNPKTPKLSTRKKVRFSTEDMGPGDVENTAGGNLSTVEGLDMTVSDNEHLKELSDSGRLKKLSNSKREFLMGEQLPPSEITEDAPELNELGDAVLADLSLSMFEADDGGEHESVWEEEEPLLSSQVEGLADRVSGLYEEGDAEMSHEEVDDAESGLAAVGCETDGFGPDDSFEVLASSFCSQVLLSSQVDDRADRHRAVQEEVRDPCLAEKVLRVDVPHRKNSSESSESFFKEDDLVKCSEVKCGTENKQATVMVSENKKAGTMNGFRTLDCDFEEDDESLCLAVALAENQQICDKEKASPDVDGNSVCVDGGSSDEDKGGLVKGVVDSKSGVPSRTIDEQKTKECSRTVGCTEDQNCPLSKTSMATVATSTSGPVTTVPCASRGEHTLTASSSSSLSAASRVSPAVTTQSLQTPQSARPLLSSATSSSSSLSTMSRVSPTVTVQSLKTLQSPRPLLSSAASSSSSSSSVVTPSSSRPSPSLAKPLLSLLTSKRKKFVYPTQRAEEETPEMRLSKLLNAALSSKLPSLQATVPHTGKVNSNIMHSPKLSETPTSSKAVRLQCVAEQPSVRQAAITPAYHSAVDCQQKAVSPKNPPHQPAMSKKGKKDLLGFARFSDVFCDEAVEEKPPETTTKGAANVLWAQEMSEGRKDNAVRSVERRDLNVGTVESVTMPEAERTSAGELTVRLCDKVVTCKLGNNNSNYRSDSSDTQNAVDKRSNHHHADAAAARVEDFIETARGTGDSPTTTPEDADEFMFSSQMWRATEFSQIESSQTHAEDGSTKVMASDKM